MKTVYAVILFLLLSLHAFAAQWRHGSPNVLSTDRYGTTYKVTIGTGAGRIWYWNNAWGVSFHPGQQMTDSEDSPALSLGKSAGGHCFWSMVFKFSKPVSRFRMSTPYCASIELGEGDFYIDYSTNTSPDSREICRIAKDFPGYRISGDIPVRQLDWVSLPRKTTELTIRFDLDGYIGNVDFSGKDEGGILEYTTTDFSAADAAETTEVNLIPSEQANVFYDFSPPKAIIGLPPECLAGKSPTLYVYDLGRNRQAGNCIVKPFGQTFTADLPDHIPGSYELRLSVPGGGETVAKDRFTIVKPAHNLTIEQMKASPFSIVAVRVFPALAKKIGVHSDRAGSPTWVTVCNEGRGIYNWGEDPAKVATDALCNGLIVRHSLSWTPGWAQLDPTLGIHGPPKPDCLTDYSNYCKELTKRTSGIYDPEFEIWNEPNNEPYGSWKGTFAQFVELCNTAADAVHSVNPKARMTLGTTGDADVGYIKKLFDAGLGPKFAIVDIHPYRHTDQGPEDGLLEDILRLQKVIKDYGNGQSIIFSEIGWPTQTVDTPGYMKVTQFQQACFFSRTYLISLAAGVKRVSLHIMTDWGPNREDPEHNFGLIDYSGKPKLSVNAVAVTSRHLERAQFKGILTSIPKFCHAWAWESTWEPASTLLTIWADTVKTGNKPQWINLPGQPTSAEDLWGGRLDSQRLRKSGNTWQVLAGEDPVFIYINRKTTLSILPLPTTMRPRQTRRVNVIPFPSGQIKVDGKLSDWGKLPVWIGSHGGMSAGAMAFAGIGRTTAITVESVSRFGVGYSPEGLLIATRVDDKTPAKNDFTGWWIWAGSCVRVYISTVDSRRFPFMSTDHFQFGLAPVTKNGGPAQAAHISSLTKSGVSTGSIITGAKVASLQGSNYWTVEAVIPWNYFGKRPKSGDQWDFDIDAGGRVWNGGEDDWNNPLHWGRMVFMGKK